MAEFWNSLPAFYRGLATSIIGGIILAIIFFILRIFGNSVRLKKEARTVRIQRIERKLRSTTPAERTEASMSLIFNTLKYLFVGLILWILPEAINPLIHFEPIYMVRLVSLICFMLGLKWIYFYNYARR